MPFLVTVEARNLWISFFSHAISAAGRGRASVFSTLVPQLIQTLILFLLSPSLFVGGLATFGEQGVRRLRCWRRQGFFDGVVAGVSSGWGLKYSHGRVGWSFATWTTLIHLMWDRWRLQAGFCLSINCFFDELLQAIVFSPPLFHLSFYRWSEIFAEEINKVRFFLSSFLIKFLENRLKMFKVRASILHLFLLKLRVMFDSALGYVDKSLRVAEIFSKKSLKINLG